MLVRRTLGALVLIAGLSATARADPPYPVDALRFIAVRAGVTVSQALPAPDPLPLELRAVLQKPEPLQQYPVKYKHHCTLRRICCGQCEPRTIVFDIPDPCCQPVEVPVLVPGCCTGDPVVSTDRDILKRHSYTYEWHGGYKVDIVFRSRGDIVVHLWGR